MRKEDVCLSQSYNSHFDVKVPLPFAVNNLFDWPILTSIESGRSPQAKWAEMVNSRSRAGSPFP